MNLKWFLTLPGTLLVSGSDASTRHLGWNLAEQGGGICFYGVIAVLTTHMTMYNDPQERRTVFSLWIYSALEKLGLFAESVAKAEAKQFSPNFWT